MIQRVGAVYGQIRDRWNRITAHEGEEVAAVAAEWWTDLLREDDVTHDNGDFFGSVMANAFRDQRDYQFEPETLDAYEDALTAAIIEKMDSSYRGDTAVVSVDYGPDHTLAEPAAAVGLDIDSLTFPIKTTMWVDVDRVQVSMGYRADPETIYRSE